jgi:predicted  nucleic acid-binding Zn-ribbon protein
LQQQLKDLLKEKEALAQEKVALEQEIAALQRKKKDKLVIMSGGDTDL